MNKVWIWTLSVMVGVVVIRGYIEEDLNLSIINSAQQVVASEITVYDIPNINENLNENSNKNETPIITLSAIDEDTKDISGLLTYIRDSYLESELLKEYRELIFQKRKKAMSYQCPVESYINYYDDGGSSALLYGDIKIYSEDGSIVLNYDCQNEIVSSISLTEEVLYKDDLYFVRSIYDRVENSYYLNTFYVLDKNQNVIIGEFQGSQLYVYNDDQYVMYINKGSGVEYVKYYFDDGVSIDTVFDEFTISKIVYDEFNRIKIKVSIMYSTPFDIDTYEYYINSVDELINMYNQQIKIESIETFINNKYDHTKMIVLDEYEYVPNTIIPLNYLSGTSDTGLIKKSVNGYYLSQGYYYLIYKPNLTKID